MDGENPLVDQTGPAQSWQFGIGLNGTLISERASFVTRASYSKEFFTNMQIFTCSAG